MCERETEICALCVSDFQELFPDRDLNQDNVSVITISHKTKSDMIAWSVDMEEEREELMEHVSGKEGESYGACKCERGSRL